MSEITTGGLTSEARDNRLASNLTPTPSYSHLKSQPLPTKSTLDPYS
jgi:hypothetical protein